MSLLAQYKLGDANDFSGNGNHGTPTNMAYVAGKIGQAGSFTYGSSKIVLPSALIPANDWTVTCWLNPTSFAVNLYPFGQYGTGGNFLARINLTTGLFRVSIGAYCNTRALVAGTWQFIGITYDSNTNLRIFVDADQYYFPNVGTNVITDQDNTALGGFGPTATRYGGLMDDARIYNEALSTWKIEAIRNFNRGTERYDPSRETFGGMQRRIRRAA